MDQCEQIIMAQISYLWITLQSLDGMVLDWFLHM